MRWVTDNNEDQISQYTDILNIVNLSGLVTGPILGFLLVDPSRRVMMKRYNDPFYASFFATNIAMFVVTAASCGLSFLAAIKEPIEIHWLTIFCDFIVRAMLYGEVFHSFFGCICVFSNLFRFFFHFFKFSSFLKASIFLFF